MHRSLIPFGERLPWLSGTLFALLDPFSRIVVQCLVIGHDISLLHPYRFTIHNHLILLTVDKNSKLKDNRKILIRGKTKITATIQDSIFFISHGYTTRRKYTYLFRSVNPSHISNIQAFQPWNVQCHAKCMNIKMRNAVTGGWPSFVHRSATK